MRITENELREMYCVDHMTTKQIGELIGTTARYVQILLKQYDIKTSDGELVWVECSWCDKKFAVNRAKWKKQQLFYCSKPHYYEHKKQCALSVKDDNRQKYQQIARKIMKAKTGQVVHHIDGNVRNNDKSNLMIFENQSEHIKFHHGLRIN